MKEDSTDEVLLAAARQGDRDAFLLLFKRYHTPIFRFLYRFLGLETAAEDITHDCFLALVRNPEDSGFKEISLLTNLYARARKLAIEHQQNHVEDKSQHVRVDEGLVETVKQSINHLPPLERETLILFEYEGLAVSEIATIVEANDEIVRMRLNQARRKLRTALSTSKSDDFI